MRRKSLRLSREQSLNAKPLAARILARQPLANGGQRITIAARTHGVRTWLLRLPATVERQFELDPVGVDVIQYCDGQKNVRYIAKRLAQQHRLDSAEAERAVTMFLQTLVRKGVLSMIVPK